MNKLIAAVMVGCLAASASFGRSFSIDLRQPSAKTCVRAAAKLKAVSSVAGGQDFLRRVNLDVGSADVGKVAVGDELAFTLFDDVAIALTLEKQMPSLLGGDVFLAEASGYEGVKNAVVICTEDGLTVDIQDYLNKKVYKVISTSAGVSVQEMEAKGGRCGCDAREPSTRAGTASAKPQKAKNVVASKNVDPDETCVDILVAYDKNAATWANANGGGVTNFAQMAVQKMNTVLVNNGLDWYFRFRLVGVMCVAAASADLDYALDAATDGYAGWDSICATRDEVGADIVTVLIDTGTGTGTTGLGWSLEADNFGSFSECAYNCCAIRSVAQSHTMTHEVGHNMGAGHSEVQENQPGPQLYSYSAGYYFSADDEKCHTIMAYDGEGPGGIEVLYFSSPYSYYKDVAVGDDTHDNRRTLANTCEAVSKWREAKGIDIGGGDDVPTAPLEWLTSRDEVFAKAKAEGRNIFLIRGSDTCLNTMGTKNNSCEDPFVKRYLLRDYVCWYKGTEWEEANGYFDGFDVGSTMPSIAIIDVEKNETLVAGGGYHTVTDLRVMLGRVAKEVSFSPESGSRFRDSATVTLSAASGSAIYYTLDGSDPSTGSSICYDMPITLTETTTIRAITFVDGVWGLPIDAEFSKSRTETSGGYEWTANVADGGCVIVSVTPEPSGDIVMPAEIEGLDVIGFDAELFKWKKNLTTLAIPGSVVEIPEFAFESCEKLSAVTIGAGVERIGSYAFGWTGLETISIPASVTNIGVRAFTGCYDMTAITVDPANEYYSSKDGFMYDKTLKHLLYCPGALRYVEIPQGVTHIGLCAFSDSNIERVVIPKTVVEIGESAFVWCGQLKSVVIPESVTNIGYSAFNLCWGLTDAYLPKSLESDYIQDDSFDTQFVGMEVTMHYYSGTLEQVAVHFSANGGELENTNQKIEIVDNKIVVPSALPVPMKTGHAFLGWFTAVDGGDEFTMDTVVTDSMTLYAHWNPNYYYLTFDANGGEGEMYTQYLYYDTPATIRARTFKREGYSFQGWALSPDGPVVYQDGESVLNLRDSYDEITLYAKWKEVGCATVVFFPNEGNGTMDAQTFTIGEEQPLLQNAFSRDGYSFEGWATSPDGDVVYLDEQDVTVSTDVSLYAVWKATFGIMAYTSPWTAKDAALEEGKLLFVLSGADWCGFCTIVKEYLMDLGDSFWDKFVVYYCNIDTDTYGMANGSPAYGVFDPRRFNSNWSTGLLSFNSGGVEQRVQAVIDEALANYHPTTYTVTFDVNCANVTAPAARTFAEGAVVEDLPSLTRSGYTFDGWWTAASGGRKISESTKVTANVTYYAHWTVNQYTVTFNANGGTGGWSRTMDYGASIVAPTVTRTSYTFAGWSPTVATMVPANDVTYNALWTKNQGPSPTPTPTPSPYPTPEPEGINELHEEIDGAAPSAAASEYNGYLYDEKSGVVKGTIQVKIGKPNAKTGLATAKATVVIGAKKVSLKGADKGKAAIEKDGPTEIELVGGEACFITLGADGLSGRYGTYVIDGSRNFFTSKDKGELSAANAILSKWLGSFMVVWDGGSLSVNIAAKGKVKVSGTLADGKTKVSANTVLLVGDEWSCVSVAAPKANLAFVLWLSHDGRTIEAEGLGDDVHVGLPGTLADGAAFHVDVDEFAAVFGQAMLPYLPDSVSVTQKGVKWTLPKAGKVVYKNGAVDETKLGENPCGLKLTYTAKSGTFKGSFKVYAEVKGKPKATTVNVTGFLLNGVGYGTATIKGKGSVAVTIE